MSYINLFFHLFIQIQQMFFYKKYFRYADEVLMDNEVLAEENNKLKAVKVKEISNLLMEGNTFLIQ